MIDINSLTLGELVELHEKTGNRLDEEYGYYDILRCSKTWVKGEPIEGGGTYMRPYSDIYKDKIELYKETKKSIDEQVEYLKKFPQLQAYIGISMDKDTGCMTDPTSVYTSKKLYTDDNQAK